MVLEELKKLNRDWATFLFLNGYEVDTLTPKKTPKENVTPSINSEKPVAETKGVNEEEM